VEIFPDEEDFAVRSFGMPSPEGYLAVCFGRVITAGSPAARADEPVNWEAILWHEFCHSVTLDLTNHQMPRWLSEGISVYEEQQENPAWGQRMTPQFRRMILDGELVSVARMGEAFAAPEGPEQVPFAYFEASLFVEFVVEAYGFDALKSVLRDLGAGLTLEVALERRTEPLANIEESFAAFARRRAEEQGSQADWEPADLGTLLAGDAAALEKWLKEHPNNLMGLHAFARHLLARGEFEQAKEPLRQALALLPGQVGPSSAYVLLAEVHRELDEPAEERRVLRELAERDGSALPMFQRLLELDLAAEDWEGALRTAEDVLAVNPLTPEPYRAIVKAAEMLDREERASVARRALERIEAGGVAEQARPPLRSAGFLPPSVTRQ
jgi:tetratricopeptide (TPR) repeat protein